MSLKLVQGGRTPGKTQPFTEIFNQTENIPQMDAAVEAAAQELLELEDSRILAELKNNYDGSFTLKSTHGRGVKSQPYRVTKVPKVKRGVYMIRQAFQKWPNYTA